MEHLFLRDGTLWKFLILKIHCILILLHLKETNEVKHIVLIHKDDAVAFQLFCEYFFKK